MAETLVLTLLNFNKTFIVETDASTITIGVVFSQDGYPLAFSGKKNVSVHASLLNICLRDVQDHRGCKKMASVSYWTILSHFYRSEKFEKLFSPNNSNTRATDLGYQATRF